MSITKIYQDLFRKLGAESLMDYSRDDIRVEYREPVVKWYLDAIEYDELNMQTDFQRESGLWDKVKRSRFIESLLMHLPITPIFLSQDIDDNYEVIDGLQRISTLNDFVRNESFRLSGMEFYPELNGLYYHELPSIAQRYLSTCRIPLSILLPGADDIIKVKIFHRVNTSGTNLNPQEIRTSLYFKTYFYKRLKEITEQVILQEFSLEDKRKDYQELVLNVISLSIFGLDNYKNENSLSDFLNESIRIFSSLSNNEVDEIFDRYIDAYKKCDELFGNNNPFINKKNRFTKAIYLTLMSVIYKDVNIKNISIDDYFKIIHSDKFLKLTTSGSSKYHSINNREILLRAII
ncbi:DUF262 domain-containing protein [Vibrio chagasii]|uniref:DUF262 domain-containing protein n=1 Tax=Vibrio chagasii TaxID=170679 RepID=UPI0038CD67DC